MTPNFNKLGDKQYLYTLYTSLFHFIFIQWSTSHTDSDIIIRFFLKIRKQKEIHLHCTNVPYQFKQTLYMDIKKTTGIPG
jgi:hypothetical protein